MGCRVVCEFSRRIVIQCSLGFTFEIGTALRCFTSLGDIFVVGENLDLAERKDFTVARQFDSDESADRRFRIDADQTGRQIGQDKIAVADGCTTVWQRCVRDAPYLQSRQRIQCDTVRNRQFHGVSIGIGNRVYFESAIDLNGNRRLRLRFG